jgi:dephospho-CoA kinase
MKNCVLILVGLPGSGKSTASEFFKKKGIPVFRMGQVTDDVLSEKKLISNEENERTIREGLRREFGEDVYAQKTVSKVSGMLLENKLIVIDGMRNEEEFEYFKKHLTNLKVLFLSVDQKIRYKRLSERKVRPLLEIEAKERDMNEIERLGVFTLRKSADYLVENEGTEGELNVKLEKVYLEITK